MPRVIAWRHATGRYRVDQAVGLGRVEPQHSIANRQKTKAAKLRCFAPRLALANRRQRRQRPTWFASPLKPANAAALSPRIHPDAPIAGTVRASGSSHRTSTLSANGSRLVVACGGKRIGGRRSHISPGVWQRNGGGNRDCADGVFKAHDLGSACVPAAANDIAQ